MVGVTEWKTLPIKELYDGLYDGPHATPKPSDFWPLNTSLWVKEFPKGDPLYAFYLLSSLDLKQFNSGAAVPTLTDMTLRRRPEALKSCPFPSPPAPLPLAGEGSFKSR